VPTGSSASWQSRGQQPDRIRALRRNADGAVRNECCPLEFRRRELILGTRGVSEDAGYAAARAVRRGRWA